MITRSATEFWTIFASVFAPLAVLILGLFWDRNRRRQLEKPPQSEKILRPPGHSLALRLESMDEALMTHMLLAFSFFAFFGASLPLALGPLSSTALISGTLAIAFATGGIAKTLTLFRQVRTARNIRLGLRGEQVVAEMLHSTAGFRIFHDFPAGENWNIDHVAVGESGVFLIETKARSRRQSRGGKPAHVVEFDGNALIFPNGTATGDPMRQAERNARWLAQFLTQKSGEQVYVQPVVALPGWFVQQTKRECTVQVVNPKNLASCLQRAGVPIGKPQLRRIVAALDEKCRDVAFE